MAPSTPSEAAQAAALDKQLTCTPTSCIPKRHRSIHKHGCFVVRRTDHNINRHHKTGSRDWQRLHHRQRRRCWCRQYQHYPDSLERWKSTSTKRSIGLKKISISSTTKWQSPCIVSFSKLVTCTIVISLFMSNVTSQQQQNYVRPTSSETRIPSNSCKYTYRHMHHFSFQI